VFVVGYGAATPLGRTFDLTWQRAVAGQAGFRRLTRFRMESSSAIVGEIPDWDPAKLDFVAPRDAYNWNAAYVFLTLAVCREALQHAGLEIDKKTGPRTACLIGSALNGTDAFRVAMDNYVNRGPLKVSPYLLPNLCANLPWGSPDRYSPRRGPAPRGTTPSGSARG
jgi:3-oxoacyl-[acyl-carrier-protein] synthase II